MTKSRAKFGSAARMSPATNPRNMTPEKPFAAASLPAKSFAPPPTRPKGFSVLSVWLAVLAVFLLLSAVAFVAYPDEQVDRLLEHPQQSAAQRGCKFPCARRREAGGSSPFWRAGCPYRCGGPWDEQDFGLSPHLVKALGATYGTLGLLALVLSMAPPFLRVAGAQCLTTWSLAQVMSSSAAFLSPEDAARRFSFHCLLIAANTATSGYAVLNEC